MRKLIVIVALNLLFTNSGLMSQVPFTTLSKEPRYLKVQQVGEELKYFSVDTITEKSLKENIENSYAIPDNILKTDSKNFDFFKNNSISTTILNKDYNRASISSKVLHYKLYIANPQEKNKYRKNRYNLPLLIVARLSTSYDSISSSNAFDAIDYEASPVTVRLMPSFKKSFKYYKDKIFAGVYADLRGLNMYNKEDAKHSLELIGSYGIGLTYQGEGDASDYSAEGEYVPGRFSFSVMFQIAGGDKDIIQRLFETNNNYVTALQAFLYFKVARNSHLNFKLGYQYLFQKTITGIQSNVSLAIGI